VTRAGASSERREVSVIDHSSEPTAPEAAAPIHVSSEWGTLVECVYGSPDRWVMPMFYGDSKQRAFGEFHDFWVRNQGRDVAEVDPERFAGFRSQIQGAIDFLRGQGIRVHVAEALAPEDLKYPRGENHGVVTGWMRDPFVTIGNNVIELAPRSLFHRRQRFAIRPILAATMARRARYFAQPDGGAVESRDEPGWGYLEGGDIFVLGKKILVGHSGGCSNPEGAKWLQHMLGPDYDVEMVVIDPMFPHLDCVLCTPREGVTIVCWEAFPKGLPEHIRDWDHIVVDRFHAKRHMACNNLVLDDRTVVVPSAEELDPVAEELRRRRFEVIRLPYNYPSDFGGSFRCAHQPLIRT
jgi:glycine amidinotransferase